MDRRMFLRNCSLIAAGVIAADSIDLLEKITGPKSFFHFKDPKQFYMFELWDAEGRKKIIHSNAKGTFQIPSGNWFFDKPITHGSNRPIQPDTWGGFQIPIKKDVNGTLILPTGLNLRGMKLYDPRKISLS